MTDAFDTIAGLIAGLIGLIFVAVMVATLTRSPYPTLCTRDAASVQVACATR